MISKELFKSRKFIVLFSMAVNIILILIGSFWFESNSVHLELSIILMLSLLFGPYSILGFAIVEIVYWILFLDMSNVPTILLSFTSLLVLGILPWKLWYSLNYKQRYGIPSLNSFYSFFKIIDIALVMVLLTYLFFNQIFNLTVSLNLESYFMIITFGIVLLLLGIGLCAKFNIALYTPTVQFKEYLPEKLYRLFFIIALILLIVTFRIPNVFCFGLILILLIIYLFKPFDDGIFEINNVGKITIFYNLFFSIFLIIALIPTILLVSFTIIGFYDYYDFASEFFNYLLILSGFLLAIFIPLLIYFLFLDNQVIRPLNQLSKYLSEEINDNEDLKRLVVNLNSITVSNEIKSLSESLLNMEREYIDYSANLLDVTKETERYETELKLANEIQHSMIPTDFEKFDDDNNVHLWGFMKAAREVGGDFYDYFKIDDDHIGFVIGDVSGKGVATSLIMVKSMTLIRDYVCHYSDLSEALHEVNNELCKDEVGDLFIGCWFGKLNTKTGVLSYVNAGHKNPLIKKNDGDFEFLDVKPGLLLAGMEDMHYEENVIHLNHDDMLFLYTDGVTFANDGNGLYGEERLQKILNQNKDGKLSDILKSVENDISEFCNNKELVDDTTMLIIKMK